MSHDAGAASPEDVHGVLLDDAEDVLATFEDLPAAVFVFRGPKHEFAAMNAAARAMIGFRPVLGKPYREAMPEMDGQRMAELLDHGSETGKQVTGREWRVLAARDDDGEPDRVLPDLQHRCGARYGRRGAGVSAHAIDVTSEVAARHAAQAATSAAALRYEEAREVALALQRSLLPQSLPVLPGCSSPRTTWSPTPPWPRGVTGSTRWHNRPGRSGWSSATRPGTGRGRRR